MANPLTMEVESKLGAVFILMLALFMAGIIFIALKNYNSDLIVLDASTVEVKSMSSTERQLIANWIRENNIDLPEGKGYRAIAQDYPDRPWLRY